MNKKGQTFGVALISVIFILIIGLMTINFVMNEITDFRVNMDCSNAAGISDATKLLCLVGGITVPYWIFLIFSIVIGGIIIRTTM